MKNQQELSQSDNDLIKLYENKINRNASIVQKRFI